MTEKAFIVKPDSDLYKQYFRAREEKLRFNDAALAFNRKYKVCRSGTFALSKTLAAKMTNTERQKFSKQIKAYENRWGLSEFKVRSEMQKRWEDEVVNAADIDIITDQRSWFFAYISYGKWSYCMWHHEKALYGYLASNNGLDINLSDEMQEIKMSEYYRAKEIVEEEQKNG